MALVVQTMLAMYIYHFLYVMKTHARQTRSFTLSGQSYIWHMNFHIKWSVR